MGQFKPMVKMMTTEPSVILKLKKGGKVDSKANGGYMPMQSTMPAQMPAGMPARGGLAPAASPMRPSMAMRRRAMNPNMMKRGGSACGDVMEELKEHEAKPMKKAHKAMKDGGKACATGGVINGQGGYKKGGGVAGNGIIKTQGQGGEFRNTKMVTAKSDKSPAKTGDVKMGNGGGYKDGGMAMVKKDGKMVPAFAADGKGKMKNGGKAMMNGGMMGGYKMGGSIENDKCWENAPANTAKAGKSGGTTGEVRKGNAGGYKMGGSTKKAYATGGTVDTGKAVAMPKKPVSRPVANSLQSGTFKKGGKVGKYSEAGPVDAKAVSDKASRELEEAMNPISMVKEGFSKVSDFVKSKMKPAGSVTKTEKSVTVAPPTKKRGGKVC